MHSAAFRRLQGKTQLFPFGESDFFRNRLTHSIEVAQVAKSIAIRCNYINSFFARHNIDTDLVEFAGLAHDIGHPPFGHNGEYILDEIMRGYGGFEGNAQTLRILSRLEKKATDKSPPLRSFVDGRDIRRGLNVTYRSLASILKYDRKIPRTYDERKNQKCHEEPCKGYYGDEEYLIVELKRKLPNGHSGRFKTIECSIMDAADDIAYSTYDLEDAFVAGLISPISILAADDSLKQQIVTRIKPKVEVEFRDLSPQDKNIQVADVNTSLLKIFSSILRLDIDKLEGRNWDTEELATYVGAEVYKTSELLAKSTYHRSKFTSDLLGFLSTKLKSLNHQITRGFGRPDPKLKHLSRSRH